MNSASRRGLRTEEIARLIDELRDLVVGQHIGKVFDACHGNLRIVIGSGASRRHLLLSLHPGTSRLLLWSDPPEASTVPGELATQMRELISGTRVEAVDQPGGDRVMRLILSHSGASGSSRELIAELFGRQGRLVILDGSSRRALLVCGRGGLKSGETYKFPPAAQADHHDSATVPFDPIQVIPVEHRGGEAPLHEWLFDRMLNRERTHILEQRLLEQRQQLRKTLRILTRRIGKLEEGLQAGARWQEWQRTGELLKGHLQLLSRGMESVEVQDWYQEGTPLVEIALEPHRTPMQNIERCFRKSRKGKRSLEILGKRKEETITSRSLIEAAMESIDALIGADGIDEEAVQKICEQAIQLNRSHGRRRQRPKSTAAGSGKVAEKRRFKRYRSRGGLEILAGSSARENDELSIRTARGNDLFFHVANRPGAHVILRVERGTNASPESIEDAAFVAAYLSGWRGPGSIPVHWTEAKHVRKPKGFPPGKVLIEREREFMVSAREEGLSSLIPQEPEE
ncbi:MAG: NFACT family protein [Planctomycetota bacterium]|nr:NFACT family protein [Planctomycetota bacterium]